MAKKTKQERRVAAKKTAIAKSISKKGMPFARTYENFEILLGKIWHIFSVFFDKYLFNPKFGKALALLLAVLFYLTINLGQQTFLEKIDNVETLDGVAVNVIVSDEAYEVSGLPETVKVRYIGNLAAIKSAKQQKGFMVVADLSDLTEGIHEINLSTQATPSGVEIVLEPSSAVVTIKKKSIRRFTLGYDYVNRGNMDSTFDLGVPEFQEGEVYVRASKDKLDSIAYVKALIDIQQAYTSDFTCKANIVAYDNFGNKLDVDIIPETIDATVEVTQPHKEVPVVLEPNGTIPNNKVIASYAMNHPTVTIYGKKDVLEKINYLPIVIPASTLTTDKQFTMPLIAPNGVMQISENFVDISIVLGNIEQKEIPNIDIELRNIKEGFSAEILEDSITSTTVIVKGAKLQIDKILPEDLKVYADLSKNDQRGVYELPLIVEGNNKLVQYLLKDTTVTIEVKEGN